MPYRATPRARNVRPRPRSATGASALLRRLLVRELRRTLRHERVLLAHEDRALLADGHDDLAAVAERVRHGAGVADRHRRGAVAIAHAEQRRGALLADRAVDD